jgi:hypothetical protein
VLEVAEVGRSDSPRPSPLARIVRIQGRPVAIDPLQGPILWDHARRTAQLLHRDRILAATDALGPGVMVITDGWTSWLQVDHRAAAPPGARFVHALTAERAAELRRRGVEIFYLPEAQWNYEAVHGVGLESLGASPLPGLSTRTGVGR